MSSGGAPTSAGTPVFTKHNWDMGMGYLWLNGWGIYHLMGGKATLVVEVPRLNVAQRLGEMIASLAAAAFLVLSIAVLCSP